MDAVASLASIVSDIVSDGNTDEILQRILDRSAEVSGCARCTLFLLNEETGLLQAKHAVGVERPNPETVAVQALFDAAGDAGGWDGNHRHPIHDRFGRLRAVLALYETPNEPSAALVEAVSGLIRIALERREQSQREEALIQVGSCLDLAVGEEELIQAVIDIAERVLRFQACSIFLLDPKLDRFVLRGTTGALKNRVGQLSYQREEGFTGWVCHSGRPIVLNDPQSDPRWRGKYVEIKSELIASFLAVPIVSRAGSVGAIRVLRRKTASRLLDNSFTPDDVRLLGTIAEQVSSALENRRNIARIVQGERMAAWGELSAKSSHMIGNRVFALKGDVNELRHLLVEPSPGREDLLILQASLEVNLSRVEEILQDFRDFVTATQLSPKPTDLCRLVQETVDEVFPKRGKVKVQLRLGDVPPVSVDAKKIRRAVSELIENAVTHMESGTIRVSTSVVRGAAERGCHAAITIEDEGPGVPREVKDLIFQPFYANRSKGMGLGLSIVKGIVESHRGEVFEAGIYGKGAKVVILLPLGESE